MTEASASSSYRRTTRWAALGVVLLAWALSAAVPERASAYYIYQCPGYSGGNPASPPSDCRADPNQSPGTHQWIARQVPTILQSDGRSGTANLLRSPLGSSTYIERIVAGEILADTGFNGCTAFGQANGWPIGDHMLNPYRGFGVLSYSGGLPMLGWQGYLYAKTSGRTFGGCATAPRVRTNSALMADEFFRRAQTHWGQGNRDAAMVNLGIAVHSLQDASVPSHSHPEVLVDDLRVQAPGMGIIRGRDAYPAWVEVNKERMMVSSGGLYSPPSSINGVTISNTPGGWVYWMAAASYPYFPWDSHWSAIPQAQARCDVTNFPEACPNASSRIFRRAQAASAGFIEMFFRSVGAAS